MTIELWIDGYSNAGYKIKADTLKASLANFQRKYPERNYQLVRIEKLWYIKAGE